MVTLIETIFSTNAVTFGVLVGWFFYPWILLGMAPRLEKNESLQSIPKIRRAIVTPSLYLGLLSSVYLILIGFYSFSGWGDRIVQAQDVIQEHEGRGTLLFLLIVYIGPLLCVAWGGVLIFLTRRVLRTGSL